MGALFSLITGVISGEASHEVKALRKAIVTYVIAGVAMACGVGFLIGAAYIASAERFGNFETALGFGAIFIVVGLLFILGHGISARRRKRRAAERRRAEAKSVAGAAAVAFIPSMLTSKKGVAGLLTPLAVILGYMIYRGSTRSSDDDLDDE